MSAIVHFILRNTNVEMMMGGLSKVTAKVEIDLLQEANYSDCGGKGVSI